MSLPSTTASAKNGRDPANDQHWAEYLHKFCIRPDSIYLNHGSFGPPPDVVRYARRQWINQLDEQPMDFYLRQLEPALDFARQRLAKFVSTSPQNLIFVDNASYAMNVVAYSVKLKADDEVLINDHEYGSVKQVWQRACDAAGAKLVCVELPKKIESSDQVRDSIVGAITDKTRLVIISHITSATALVMPVAEICAACREREVLTCVDGPHAPVQIELDIDGLNCDFYCASLHKWLCATLGSGFLYVHPRQQASIEPPIKSWGRLLPAVPSRWDEEFVWVGSRDPSPFLSVPVAIDFMEHAGIDSFRRRSGELARYAEAALRQLWHTEPIGSRDAGHYRSMAHVPLPTGDWSGLQNRLWQEVGIEVMINRFDSRFFCRVSAHLYNTHTQIDTLVRALARMV